MQRAEEQMKARDPSGARQEAGDASKKLGKLQEGLRKAARNGVTRTKDDEPIRIPGADEYKAPEKFREDILDAMKNHEAPAGYDDRVRRYYEELIR